VSCLQEPIPSGWRVWKGPVPPELVQFAIAVRNKINEYQYGTIAQTTTYGGQTVGAFKSHHTWTYRPTGLVTGICIPGISLVVQTGTSNSFGLGQPSNSTPTSSPQGDLSQPDPSLAVFGAEDGIDWPLVAASAIALASVVGLFFLGLKHAGRR
jgi:hypothetical protein